MINLPGLGNTGDRKAGIGVLLRPGKYVFEVQKWEAYLSDKSPTLVNKISLLIIEGIGQTDEQLDGAPSKGIKFTYMITTPVPEHPKYNEWWGESTRAELAQLLQAAGVVVSDDCDEQDAVGKVVIGEMKHQKESDGSFRNFCMKWTPDVTE